MKFSENLPKTLIYIVKTKFLKTTTFWGSKMAKNHYLWLRAPGPTPHLWPPKRAIFRFFPDMTPIPQFRPWKILTSLKISEKSNNGINLPPKTLLCAPKSPFQPSYKLFFHTFRPKGPKARRKKAHFISQSWRPRRPQDNPKCAFFPSKLVWIIWISSNQWKYLPKNQFSLNSNFWNLKI